MSKQLWKQYFLFTAKEQKGLVVIGCILLTSFLLSFLLPSSAYKKLDKNRSIPVRLFVFDPNSIDSLQALELGITPLQAHHLINYRNKKGKFYKKEDFKKLWGLPNEKYLQLLPYIKIDTSIYVIRKSINFYWTIDINHASLKEWKQKAALSEREARLIMRYKNYLGAFTKVQQVNNVFGLSDTLLLRLRPHLRVEPNRMPIKLAANSMPYGVWQRLGLFSDAQIIQILRVRKAQKGKITWAELVNLCDMTQAEAEELRTKVSFEN
jgi:DNA uptake protein ComE-like DNA-binding protein